LVFAGKNMTGFIEQFGDIPDRRIDRTKNINSLILLFITMTFVICVCDEWKEIEPYEEKKGNVVA
jgi:hypothetical protein